jgi:hypothetical protein
LPTSPQGAIITHVQLLNTPSLRGANGNEAISQKKPNHDRRNNLQTI